MRTIGDVTMDGIVVGRIEIEHGPEDHGSGENGAAAGEHEGHGPPAIARLPRTTSRGRGAGADSAALWNKRFGLAGPHGSAATALR